METDTGCKPETRTNNDGLIHDIRIDEGLRFAPGDRHRTPAAEYKSGIR